MRKYWISTVAMIAAGGLGGLGVLLFWGWPREAAEGPEALMKSAAWASAGLSAVALVGLAAGMARENVGWLCVAIVGGYGGWLIPPILGLAAIIWAWRRRAARR